MYTWQVCTECSHKSIGSLLLCTRVRRASLRSLKLFASIKRVVCVCDCSHKSNYSAPPTLKQGGDGLPECVRRVAAPPGAAIVFTESLLHTTLPWTGDTERRTLFLKYSPTAVSWSGEYYDVDDPVLRRYELTEQEITLMEPPNARHGARSWLAKARM